MDAKVENKLRHKIADLVDEYFPKGDKRRGDAIAMMARFFVEGVKGEGNEKKKKG